MSLKFEKPAPALQVQQAQPRQQNTGTYKPIEFSNIGLPPGPPIIGLPGMPIGVQYNPQSKGPPPLEVPGANLKRAVNYYADYGGCGWWRMIAPELLINLNQTGVICGLTTMVVDPRFYQGMNAVRLQRQATPIQLEFVRFLKAGSAKFGFKTIYEIDDIIFKDDIPLFNRCRVAFENEDIFNSSLEMMKLCDEVCVTCEYMKQYYIEKTGNKNITVIPNYPAKMWFDNRYNEKKIMENYDKNKKRPRILYAGSGTHIDVTNRTNQQDDFSGIVQFIIKTRNKFKWVFVGCFPLPCKPFIDRGEMEFIQWYPLKDLPKAYIDTNPTAVYAPLMDCTFNKAKSNIKFLEAGCCGIPGVFQDLVTYKDSFLRFKTGSDLINQLEVLLKDENTYADYSRKSRAYAETMWLDDHLEEFQELYFTRIGDPNRKALIKLNPDQDMLAK